MDWMITAFQACIGIAIRKEDGSGGKDSLPRSVALDGTLFHTGCTN